MLAVDRHLIRFYREHFGYEPILRGRFSHGLGCYRTPMGGSGVYAEKAYGDRVRETREPALPPEARAETRMDGLLFRAGDGWDAVVLDTGQVVPNRRDTSPQGRLHRTIFAYLESCGWFWVPEQRAFGHPTSSRAYDTVNAFKLQVEKEAGHRVSFGSAGEPLSGPRGRREQDQGPGPGFRPDEPAALPRQPRPIESIRAP